MDDSSPSIPESDPASPVPASVTSDDTDEEASGKPADVSHLPAEHRDAVRRLHRRVQEAINTIERLRAENRRLRKRVEELEAQPSFPDAETVLALDENPDALRKRINHFIDTIDTYLEATPSEEEEPSAPSTDDDDA
jgi:predicted RNase H-like nuclease (RuvC/YqgF family)